MNSDERKLLQLTLRIARAVIRAKLNTVTYEYDSTLLHYFAIVDRNRIARLRRAYKKQAGIMKNYSSGRASVVINCQARLIEDGEDRNSTWLTV